MLNLLAIFFTFEVIVKRCRVFKNQYTDLGFVNAFDVLSVLLFSYHI